MTGTSQSLPPKPHPHNRRYWLRLGRLFVFALAIALLALPVCIGIFTALGLLYAPCAESPLTPADFGYHWEDVTLQARAGGTFRGYFIPGTNGATVVIPPSLNSGRGNRLPIADLLFRHGYSVFIFESRRCAGIGPLSLGYHEVDEVADAVDYLLTREDVDPDRIGVHGFSSAGATAIMAAARLPSLRAVIAEGGYGDFEENALGTDYGDSLLASYFEFLFRGALKLTYRLVIGDNIQQLSPVATIGEIAPRPILLIYGSKEASLGGARQLKLAAGDNAELWIVASAGHGNYLQVAPDEYERRVVSFLNEALKSK
ncbi:MAG: prolyl oligopeptidase family serine peptidase [Anaerolineae bacterium]|nr:prolyl oligopeptidase family serine peptidase [Anaerolineae bacterium]